MPAITVPPKLKPALDAIGKYHFWILAALVPLALLQLSSMGTTRLKGDIAKQRQQIDGKLGQARSVAAVQPHANENWVTAIDAATAAVQRETLDEWRRFWHSQQDLRIWPDELGEQFLDDMAALKQPDGVLPANSLRQYWEKTKTLVRTLPARMGVKDLMVAVAADGPSPEAARPGAPAPPRAPVAWNAQSQQRVYASFTNWPTTPTTAQVLLAQEELWVYGLFCDLINGFVKSGGATGAHDSPLTFVDELTIGFPAIAGRDQTRSQRRIELPEAPAAAPPDPMLMGSPPGIEASGPTPWHPRFTNRNEPTRAGPDGAGQPTGPTDDDYRSWIYVDFAGKPLSAADLTAAPAMQMVHLMPFVLRVIVDQRQLDRLLATLAAAPIPIDVREVRVNPGAKPTADEGGERAAAEQVEPDGRPKKRTHDLVVEIHGTVALATRPPAGATTTEGAP